MGVRTTESRLPSGFRARDLGQAEVIEGAGGSEDIALVSSLSSPVGISSFIDYSVFVTTGEQIDEYRWTFDPISSPTVDTVTTTDGVTTYQPLVLGLLEVTVKLMRAGTEQHTLTMFQEIRPRFQGFGFSDMEVPGYEALFALAAGDPLSTPEVTDDFRGYINESAAGHDLPPRFLAAVIYQGCMQAPKHQRVSVTVWTPGRDQKLDRAADDINLAWWRNVVDHLDNRLGVAQWRPPNMAALVGEDGLGGDPHIDWREKAVDGSDASEIDHVLWTDFDELTVDNKTDLFNLARFPKASIETAAAYLAALRARWPAWQNLSVDELVADEDALVTLATEYEAGAHVTGGATPSTGWGKSTVGLMWLPVLVGVFPDSLQDGADAYGGHDLQRDDNDDRQVWGGQPGAGPGTYVDDLQWDLSELGFRGVGNPDGDFGRRTEWAVREFQIYAGMRFLATETATPNEEPRYIDRLEQVLNLYPYSGPISGVANLATRILIALWKRRGWRCPVVIEAWDTDWNPPASPPAGVATTPGAPIGDYENIWRHNDATIADGQHADTRLMFALDLSGYYDMPADAVYHDGTLIDVGCYVDGPNPHGGPTTRPNLNIEVPPESGVWKKVYSSVWPAGEMTSERLLGVPLAELSAAQRATFKVVRAVSEVECLGYFDSINCYDRAIVSLGPAHWTLGLYERDTDAVEDGELCGFLAYLAAFDGAAFHQAVERFGIRIEESWINGADRSGGALFDQVQRKYKSMVTVQTDDGRYTTTSTKLADFDYYRSWHWAYRWIMAGRTVTGFQRAMWDMARIRLRDVRDTPFPDGIGPQIDGRSATIGEIFTSEKAAGMLHRWHIYQPESLIEPAAAGAGTGIAGQHLQEAVAAATTANAFTDPDPDNWNEDEVITALQAEVDDIGGELKRTVRNVTRWPRYPGRATRGYALNYPDVVELSAVRNSFKNNFDADDLPDPPTP